MKKVERPEETHSKKEIFKTQANNFNGTGGGSNNSNFARTLTSTVSSLCFRQNLLFFQKLEAFDTANK